MKRLGQAIALVVLSGWFTLGVCASLTTVELKNLPERERVPTQKWTPVG